MRFINSIAIAVLATVSANEIKRYFQSKENYENALVINVIKNRFENIEPYFFVLSLMDDTSAKMETRIVAVKKKPIKIPKKTKIDTFIEPKKITIKPPKLKIIVSKLKDTL